MKVLTIRADDLILKKMKEKAKKEGRGLAEILRQLMAEYLERENGNKNL